MRLYFRPQPKSGPKPKKKPKPLNLKKGFKTYENAGKNYRHRRSEADIRRYAEECREKRLAARTEAETRLQEILKEMGVEAEAERIFYITDTTGKIANFIILDFMLKTPDGNGIAIELDGFQHSRQVGYDRGRDEWLERTHGIKTFRLKNKEVFASNFEEKLKEVMSIW